MLASIGVMLAMTTKTRHCQRQGTVANRRKNKTGQNYRQRNETLTTTTSTKILEYQKRKRLRDANDDNGNN